LPTGLTGLYGTLMGGRAFRTTVYWPRPGVTRVEFVRSDVPFAVEVQRCHPGYQIVVMGTDGEAVAIGHDDESPEWAFGDLLARARASLPGLDTEDLEEVREELERHWLLESV